MAGIVEDAAGAADWIARALSSSGYAADFTPQSLAEIDRFFDDQMKNGSPKRRGLLAKDLGARLFAVGAYVGEVLRRELGGEWRPDPADPENELGLSLELPDGAVVSPVERAMKRYANGDEDSIAAYGAALGLEVTVFERQPRGRFRRRR